MPLTHAVAFFFGGAFLANFVPHFVLGISGRRFPTPFAQPPFRGLSPPPVNVLYALINLAAAYALLVLVGKLELHQTPQLAILATGFALASLGISSRAAKVPRG